MGIMVRTKAGKTHALTIIVNHLIRLIKVRTEKLSLQRDSHLLTLLKKEVRRLSAGEVDRELHPYQ